jgi:hypothetical protein
MKATMIINIEIAKFYPKSIGYLAIYDVGLNLWGYAIIKTHIPNSTQEDIENGMYDVAYCDYEYKWKDEDDALFQARVFVQSVLDSIKVMSN